jgi:hypothetical protein
MKAPITDLIDFSKPLLFLKRIGDIMAKIFPKIDAHEELLAMMFQWNQSTEEVPCLFSMYLFEIMTDFHLPIELINKHAEEFLQVFTSSLVKDNLKIKVAALKATSCFLSSLEEEETVKKCSPVMDNLLEVVVSALKNDEEQGRLALDSLTELANFHPDAWSKHTQKLMIVVSQIMQTKSFEDSTRNSALEIVLTLTDGSAGLVRNLTELNEMLFPAIMGMLAEPPLAEDDEQQEWADHVSKLINLKD